MSMNNLIKKMDQISEYASAADYAGIAEIQDDDSVDKVDAGQKNLNEEQYDFYRDWKAGLITYDEYERKKREFERSERDFEKAERNKDRGPWYIKIDGKILNVGGQPKVFDWKSGATNYGLAILKKRPELKGKITLTKSSDVNEYGDTSMNEGRDDKWWGTVHKGGYGSEFDVDDDGEEVKKAEPAVKRGRGRPPKTGAHVSSPEEKRKQKDKEEASKALQSFMVGNLPKGKLPGKPGVKHKLKDWIEHVESTKLLESSSLAEAIPPGMKPLAIMDPQNKSAGVGVVTSQDPDIQNMLKGLDPKKVQVVMTQQAPGAQQQPAQAAKPGQPTPAGATGQAPAGSTAVSEKYGDSGHRGHGHSQDNAERLKKILQNYPHEHKLAQEGWGVHESLYQALCDFYWDEGRIPRDKMYGPSHELRDWVEECYATDTNQIMETPLDHHMTEMQHNADAMEESALQAYLGKKKYGEEGMKALQQAGREGASKEKMADLRAKYDKLDEIDGADDSDKTKEVADWIETILRTTDKSWGKEELFREMPDSIKANPDRFDTAFEIAYTNVYGSDEYGPEEDDDYTDISMRKGELGILEQGVAEGLTEMDKSAPQPGRDGRVSHSTYGSRDKKGSDYFTGKEAPGKPITAKQMSKDALDILKKQGELSAGNLSGILDQYEGYTGSWGEVDASYFSYNPEIEKALTGANEIHVYDDMEGGEPVAVAHKDGKYLVASEDIDGFIKVFRDAESAVKYSAKVAGLMYSGGEQGVAEGEIEDAEAAHKKINTPAAFRKAQGGDWKVTRNDLEQQKARSRTSPEGLAAVKKHLDIEEDVGNQHNFANSNLPAAIRMVRDSGVQNTLMRIAQFIEQYADDKTKFEAEKDMAFAIQKALKGEDPSEVIEKIKQGTKFKGQHPGGLDQDYDSYLVRSLTALADKSKLKELSPALMGSAQRAMEGAGDLDSIKRLAGLKR